MEKQEGLSGTRAAVLQQGPRPLHHAGRRPCWNTAPLGTQKPDDRRGGDDESQAPGSTLGHEDHPRLQAESHRRCLFLGRIEQLKILSVQGDECASDF